jgi:hypothetical protein
MRNAYEILIRQPEGKRTLGRHKGRWEGGITIDLREIRSEVVDWINLAQDRDQWRAVVNTIMELRVS